MIMMLQEVSDVQLDILIELGGFTADSRIEILLRSPIQLSYLGYFEPIDISA